MTSNFSLHHLAFTVVTNVPNTKARHSGHAKTNYFEYPLTWPQRIYPMSQCSPRRSSTILSYINIQNLDPYVLLIDRKCSLRLADSWRYKDFAYFARPKHFNELYSGPPLVRVFWLFLYFVHCYLYIYIVVCL